jgi:predicted aminopeptidase
MRSAMGQTRLLGRFGIGLSLCVPALAAIGCSDPGYAIYAVGGQLDLISRARPIQDVLDDGSLTPEQQATVQDILAIRGFAANDLQLRVGDSYTSYLDTGGDPVAYNLSAAAKDSLTPVTWTFPIAGTVPYLGFFHMSEARDYQDRLVAQGYDTVLYGVEAYSTLGTFPDPITTTMLARTEVFLADLIIHESTHNTVWRQNDTDFNENVATFVGRTGAILYLTDKYGGDSQTVIDAQHAYQDADLYNTYLSDLYVRLQTFYGSDLTPEQKLFGRAGIFAEAQHRFADEVLPQMYNPDNFQWVTTLEINNAWILANARYNSDLSAFQAVYDSTGGDFAAALQIFMDATQAADPIAYLRNAAR